MSVITQKLGQLEYLTAEGISAPHCFTTRLGGVSTGSLESLNLGTARGDKLSNVVENYRRIGEAVGFVPQDVVMARQTHSDIVLQVGREHRGAGLLSEPLPECDALITNEPGVALFVSTADCTPILLHDPVTGAVGAAHAGWRGTAAGIAEQTVQALVRGYGCDPADILAAIGPGIGPCCFETHADVPDGLRAGLGRDSENFIFPIPHTEKFRVDLKGSNAQWLTRAGLLPEHIAVCSHCTACRPDLFWSHRRMGTVRGSMASMIQLM